VAIVGACRGAGVPVVARGVTSHADWRTLAEIGCAFVQGAYVAPWTAEPIEPTTHVRLSNQPALVAPDRATPAPPAPGQGLGSISTGATPAQPILAVGSPEFASLQRRRD
jgi:EAL domain-containing protein (putative c-di-GMP-specific phosphodiesterase class I)